MDDSRIARFRAARAASCAFPILRPVPLPSTCPVPLPAPLPAGPLGSSAESPSAVVYAARVFWMADKSCVGLVTGVDAANFDGEEEDKGESREESCDDDELEVEEWR